MKKITFLFLVLVHSTFAQNNTSRIHSAIGKIVYVELSPDGSLGVACSAPTKFYGENVASVVISDTKNKKVIKEFAVATLFATFSPDNSKLLYWNFSKGLTVVDLANYEEKVVLENIFVDKIVSNAAFRGKFSRDGKLIALGGFEGEVRIMDATTYKFIRTLQSNDDKETCSKLEFMSDGTLVTVGGGVVKTWDVLTGKEVQQYSRAKLKIVGVSFATEVNKVLIGYGDSLFVAWSKTGKIISEEDYGGFHNAFSPKGTLYLLFDSKVIYAFNRYGSYVEEDNSMAIRDCEWIDIDRNETKVLIGAGWDVHIFDFDYFKRMVMKQ